MPDPRPCCGDLFTPTRHVAGVMPTCSDCAELGFEEVWGESTDYPVGNCYGKCMGAQGRKAEGKRRD